MLAARLAVPCPNPTAPVDVDDAQSAPGASRVALASRRHVPPLPRPAAGPPDADVALIRRLLLRDARAWRAFHRRFEPLVLAAVRKVVSRFRICGAPSDIDEIRAALFASLIEDDLRKLRSFDPSRGSLDGFLRLLATHAAWNYVRVRTRQCRGTTGEGALAELFAPDDPFHALDIKHCALRVQEALRALSEADRRFAELLFVEDRSAEQVAVALSLAIETVYTKKSRIQARLRRLHAL